jgi:hypothetical protein
LQRTTATIGSVCATDMPSRSATCDITFEPPTGQFSPSSDSLSAARTKASAIPLQPGNPHPPQLAPGNTSATFASRGSSSTANLFETTKRMAEATNAIVPSTTIANNMKFIMKILYVLILFSYSQYASVLLRELLFLPYSKRKRFFIEGNYSFFLTRNASVLLK